MAKKTKRRAGAAAGEEGNATCIEGEDGSKGASLQDAAPEAKRRKNKQKSEAMPSQEPEAQAHDDEDEDEDEVEDEEDDEEVYEDVDAEEPEDEEEQEGEEDGEENQVKRIWRPGIDQIEEGEQLDVEPGTYDMLHRAQVEWPCLSFDIVRDDLGAQRATYPMTSYIVAGTQADQAADNRIYMMKWSRLYRTSKDGKEESDDEDDESESDEDDDHEAVLESKAVAHPGCVNRIRAMPQAGHIVATWSDTGKVYMWNLEAQRKALDRPSDKVSTNTRPIFTCEAHKEEGYAMDWSPHETGRFLSGGNDGLAFLWCPAPGGWKVASEDPFRGHSASVEDVQWKRHGAGAQSIFASCSSDKSFRVWDVREQSRTKSAVHVPEAHPTDVNVLCWSPCVGELIITGADDGGFKIWDTRNTGAGAMANFLWHRKPITSVDWHPTDETVMAVSSADDTVSIWDMAVEDDAEGAEKPPGAEHYPPQLLFLHMGQREPKELRWHPQIPSVCVSTAGSGFNIFKTCNV